MYKNELLELLNMKIVSNEDINKVELLLQLNSKEVKMLLDNKEIAKELFELICELKQKNAKQNYYNLALLKASEIKDHKLLIIFIKIASNLKLLKSLYYEFTLNELSKITDVKFLDELYNLAINPDLLNSDYYELVISKAVKINNLEQLYQFVHISTNQALLNSNNYSLIINEASNITDVSLLKHFKDIVTNEALINKPSYFKLILQYIIKVTDVNLLYEFGLLVTNQILLNSDYYKLIITIAEELNDYKILKNFRILSTSTLLLSDKNKYLFVINLARSNPSLLEFFIQASNILFYKKYYEFALNKINKLDPFTAPKYCEVILMEELLKSEYYEFIVNLIFKMNKKLKVNQLKKLVIILLNNEFLLNISNLEDKLINLNSISIDYIDIILKSGIGKFNIYRLLELKNEKILSLTSAILNTINSANFLEYDKKYVTSTIFKTLELKSESSILVILEEILNEVVEKSIEKKEKTLEEKIQENIESRRISNIISKNKLEDLPLLLEGISNKENITNNTYVKKI